MKYKLLINYTNVTNAGNTHLFEKGSELIEQFNDIYYAQSNYLINRSLVENNPDIFEPIPEVSETNVPGKLKKYTQEAIANMTENNNSFEIGSILRTLNELTDAVNYLLERAK